MNSFFNYKNSVKSRSDLLTLLSEACELEHGLACSYLFTAFSLKQNVDEGISAAQFHLVKKWASKIFFVASQEMLHLAQVWNLMNAIGGTPYYFRPNFPQTSKYYPFNLPLKLEPFSPESLKRFIAYELPSNVDEKKFVQNAFGFVSEDDYLYKTVGELYRLIAEGIEYLGDELFSGDEQLQLGRDDIDSREIIKIKFSFNCKSSDGKKFADYAILRMIRVVKPLGELLTQMPAFDEPFFKNAGASFSLNRHIPLPADLKIAKIVVSERGNDILFRLRDMKNGEFDREFDEIAENFAAVHYDAAKFSADIVKQEIIELA